MMIHEGIDKAKAEGKYKGRAKTAMAKAGGIETLLAAGVSPTQVARKPWYRWEQRLPCHPAARHQAPANSYRPA